MGGDAQVAAERVGLGEDVDRVEVERGRDPGGGDDAGVGGESLEAGLCRGAGGGDPVVLVVAYCVGSAVSASSPQPASVSSLRAAAST